VGHEACGHLHGYTHNPMCSMCRPAFDQLVNEAAKYRCATATHVAEHLVQQLQACVPDT
jgi:hypothetical protein